MMAVVVHLVRRNQSDQPILWGKYATGGPNPKAARCVAGDDGGCFASAIDSVRRFGGVIEHPATSLAWASFGLPVPPHTGGWIRCLDGGWTCHVEQGHYGHRARKMTWLYAVRCPLPSLVWGPSVAIHDVEEMSRKERTATPLAFADVLMWMARGVR